MSTNFTTGTEENNRIRNRLKELIKMEGGNARKFFESCGIKQQTGDRWIQESGTRIPAWGIAKISKAKNKPVAWFFHDPEPDKPPPPWRDPRHARLIRKINALAENARIDVIDALLKLVGVIDRKRAGEDQFTRLIASADPDLLEALEKEIAERREKLGDRVMGKGRR